MVRPDPQPPEPRLGAIRIVIAGQANVGKSSLVNAMAGDIRAIATPLPGPADYKAYEVARSKGESVILVDAPALDISTNGMAALGREAQRADMIIWVCAAPRADRDADSKILETLRAQLEKQARIDQPPYILVATHIDKLSPAGEWNPPYDLDANPTGKAASITSCILM